MYLTGRDDGFQPGESRLKVYRFWAASANNGRKQPLTTKHTKTTKDNKNAPRRHKEHRGQQEIMGTTRTAKSSADNKTALYSRE